MLDNMNIKEIQKHLYNDSSESAIKYINILNDEESLFVYANNYNWDNGFDVPKAIINNPACSLSIALLLFYLADGITYLSTKKYNENLPEWSNFISFLYERIISNSFTVGKVSFKPDLSKIQLFKLKKSLSEKESIFITEIEGFDCYINL